MAVQIKKQPEITLAEHSFMTWWKQTHSEGKVVSTSEREEARRAWEYLIKRFKSYLSQEQIMEGVASMDSSETELELIKLDYFTAGVRYAEDYHQRRRS